MGGGAQWRGIDPSPFAHTGLGVLLVKSANDSPHMHIEGIAVAQNNNYLHIGGT